MNYQDLIGSMEQFGSTKRDRRYAI